jgi:tetratricopeptide (TPR) repeat protein
MRIWQLTRTPAATLLIALVCSPALAQGKRRASSASPPQKQSSQQAESQSPARPDQPRKKVNCDQPPMDAGTEAALKSAGQRGDFGKLREIIRNEMRRSPDVCGWYALFIATALKAHPDNDADLDELLAVISEYQRRKLSGHNDVYVLMARRMAYREKSDLAIARGEFDQGIAFLRKLALLGDPESQVQSNLHISFAYLRRYAKTQSRGDAAIVRTELRAALGNKAGLEKVIGDDQVLLANVRMMLGGVENDLGNYPAAVSELELAQSLDPSNSDIPRMLSTVRENLRGGGRGVRFVSIQDIIDMLSSPGKRP